MTTLTQSPTVIDLAPVIARVSKDAKAAASTMSSREARYLVDTYYQMQENRKRAANQVLAMGKSGEPNATIQWLLDQSEALEKRVALLLNHYAKSSAVGRWAMSQYGVGPIIAAGLMAHIDIDKCPTVGHIWAFAGVAGGAQKRWEKGQKRPWNASLKTLVWKIGQSFLKFHNQPDCFYGKVYEQRKAYEVARNERLEYADQAKDALARKKIGKDTEAFKWLSKGMLPPAHIEARVQRYAAKLFLAHWHEIAYEDRHGRKPPMPYPIAHMGHVHRIDPPATTFE